MECSCPDACGCPAKPIYQTACVCRTIIHRFTPSKSVSAAANLGLCGYRVIIQVACVRKTSGSSPLFLQTMSRGVCAAATDCAILSEHRSIIHCTMNSEPADAVFYKSSSVQTENPKSLTTSSSNPLVFDEAQPGHAIKSDAHLFKCSTTPNNVENKESFVCFLLSCSEWFSSSDAGKHLVIVYKYIRFTRAPVVGCNSWLFPDWQEELGQMCLSHIV